MTFDDPRRKLAEDRFRDVSHAATGTSVLVQAMADLMQTPELPQFAMHLSERCVNFPPLG